MRKNFKILLFLFFLAMGSGLFWSYQNFGKSVPQIGGDEGYYNKLAEEYVRYGEFVSYRTDPVRAAVDPLYPLFIAGIYSIFGIHYDLVRVIQLLLFVSSVLLFYFLVLSVASRRIAVATGVLCALYYPLAGVVTRFNKETLFTFLVISLMYTLQKVKQTKKNYWFVLAAIAFSLSYLINSVMLFFPLFVLLGYFFVYGKFFMKRKIFLKVVIFLFLSALVPIYILVGNRLLYEARSVSGGIFIARKLSIIKAMQTPNDYFNHFVGLTLGYYFAEKLDSGINIKLFLDYFPAAKAFRVAKKKGEGYDQFANNLNKEIIKETKHHWPNFILLCFYDFLQFNGPIMPNKIISAGGPMQNMFIQNSHPGIPVFFKVAILLFLRLLYWLFCGLVIYGIIKTGKQWRTYIWIYLLIIYFNIVFSIIFGLARYAIPIYPFYIMFAVVGAFSLYPRFKNFVKKEI